MQRDPIPVNADNSTLQIPHWGVTLRTLFGAAVAAWPDAQAGERKQFRVLHKGKEVAVLNIQQHDDIN